MLDSMFSTRACLVSECRRHAVERSDTCFHHLKQPAAYLKELAAWLEPRREASGLSLSRLHWSGASLPERAFDGCNFSGARWEDLDLTGCSFRHCFFDFGSFTRCVFRKTSFLFCSVSGCRGETSRIFL